MVNIDGQAKCRGDTWKTFPSGPKWPQAVVSSPGGAPLEGELLFFSKGHGANVAGKDGRNRPWEGWGKDDEGDG